MLPTERTMTNFEQLKTDSDQWYSPPFYTHPQGYKMCLRVNTNGNGKGKGTHVSVFTYLMRGKFDDHLKWPFQGHVTVAMLRITTLQTLSDLLIRQTMKLLVE